jgi:mRNA interferase RelE/StbE
MRADDRKQLKEPAYSKQAEKYLEKLEARVHERLRKAILDIPLGNVKKLQGHGPYFRLDIKANKVSYRVIFRWISDEQIHVMKIRPRGDAYKGGF